MAILKILKTVTLGSAKRRRRKRRLLVCLVVFSVLLATCFQSKAMPADSSREVDLSLDCKSAILVEVSTGKVLYEQNADEPLPPASVTKIMTLLLVMEAIEEGRLSYSDKVRASANACSMGGSQIFLEENEEMSVEDLLKSVIIASANDAAVVLAECVAGSEELFVAHMNERARELGMKDTCFENTNGLDDSVEKHLISARDIATMSRELIKYPKITEYSSIWMDSIRGGEFGLTNTNRLVRFYKGATGLKTGSTAKAGFCISATAERDGMGLVAVIMGAPSRDVRNAAATKLLDYGFANYCSYHEEGEEFSDIPVEKGSVATIDAKSEGFSAVLKKSERDSLTKKIELKDSFLAPVEKGEKLGEVIFLLGEAEIGRSDILAAECAERLNFWGMLMLLLRKCAMLF